jgi:galactokinase
MNTLQYSGSLTDVRMLTAALAESGLHPRACRTKAERFAQAVQALTQRWSCNSTATPTDRGASQKLDLSPFPCGYFVPGRIEVLGKHTDYAGGSSLVAAAERGFCLVVAARKDTLVRITDAVRAETIEFPLSPDLTPPVGLWNNYPMTVARRLCRNFSGLRHGAEIAFSSDLPPASGMSSSSALMVATFFALAETNGLFDRREFPAELSDPLRLAEYLGMVENGQSYGRLEGDRGVGTFGGSEDHTAMLCAEPDRLSRFAYCPTRREGTFALPEEYLFAIAASGVLAEKTGEAMEKYNRASRLVARLAELWPSNTGGTARHLKALLDQSPGAAERLRQKILSLASSEAADLEVRLAHFLAENETIIPAACEALRQGNVAEFGRQVYASQQAAEKLLKNQIPETIYLASSARQSGAAAASAFGAGFGGSVWAIVEQSQADRFLSDWSNAYRSAFPQHAARSEFFLTSPSPAAFRILSEVEMH